MPTDCTGEITHMTMGIGRMNSRPPMMVYPMNSSTNKSSKMSKKTKQRRNVSSKDRALRQAQSSKAKAQNKSVSSSVMPCTQVYGASLIDPFRKDLSPCVPYGVSLRSQKICVFAEGSFMTGTTGYGGITVYGNLVSDYTCATVTKASYTTAGLPTYGENYTENASFVNSPFVSSDLQANSGVELRLCSLGVRVRYVGTELNRGGLRFALQHPEHLSVEGLNDTAISSFDFRQIDGQTRDWTAVVYTPLRQNDYNFTSVPTGNTSIFPFMGILVQSADASTPAPFEYQVVAHFEAIGSKARGKTISNSDPTGTMKVVSAMSQGPPGLSTAVSNHKLSAINVANLAAKDGSEMWSTVAMKAGQFLGGYAAEAAALALLL